MNVKLSHIILLAVVCFFAFFLNNRVLNTDIMESRNVITAREMVYDGHWMVPTMNGELRLEKPPLPTWIAAGAERLAPDDMGAQRAMAGFAAVMLVGFFYALGRAITRNDSFALISSLVLCTSYNLILMGRTASWDIYCHAFMLGAIYFLFQALQRRGRQWGCFIGAGLMMGLSFLSKGPVAFYALLLPFLISYVLLKRSPMRKKGTPLVIMIIITLLVSSWWYLYIGLFHTDVAMAVLNKESATWTGHNVRPWYYYATFFLETGVWALLLITTLPVPYWGRVLKQHRDYLFTLCWMVLLLVCLSLFPEKKNRYLLPMLIPAAYTMGFLLLHWVETFKKKWISPADRWIYLVNVGLLTLVVTALPVVAYFTLYVKGMMRLPELGVLTLPLWGLAALLVTAMKQMNPKLYIASVVLLLVAGEVFGMPLIGRMVNNPEMKSICATREVEALKPLPFYSAQGEELRIELVYEANKRIAPLQMDNADSIMAAMPCAVLTHRRVGEVLPAELWEQADSLYIDHYDNNRRPKGSRRYDDKFLYHVTILKAKQ